MGTLVDLGGGGQHFTGALEHITHVVSGAPR